MERLGSNIRSLSSLPGGLPAPVPEPVATFAAITRTLTESLELGEVLRRICSEVLKLTRSQGVSIIMRRGELAEFVAHESPPPHSLIPVGFQFEPKPQLRSLLSNRREPVIIQDLHASPLIPESIKERIGVRDLIILPLRVEAELMGVLVVAYAQLPETWSWDPGLLCTVGDQAALAIRNAQLYEEARTATERLVQNERLSALGKVIAQVAHEVNNPLTTARLIAEGLEMERLPAGVHEQVRAVAREIERAASVVHDLLVFARKGRRTFTTISVEDVIRGTVEEQGWRLAAAGVHVEVVLEESLPLIEGDARALRQVLTNLFQNAAHALSAVDGDRRITIRAAAENTSEPGHIVIETEDNGPGIPREARENLFEPFFTTKAIGEGTGLGLPIAKEIIEVHGGTITAEDAPSGGALFRIRLPALPSGVRRDETPPRTAGTAALPRKGLRVLVIDDEVELQRAIRRVLQHLGCAEVTCATTGEEGLDYAREGDYDLILCDIRIPGLHGRELYDRLMTGARETRPALAFMTGDTLSDEVRTFVRATGRPVLVKPFGRAQLEELLASVPARRS